MDRVLLEICCGSAEDVIEAYAGGANRVELNSNLFQGGLTPTIGSLEVAKANTSFPIMTMVRPRAGGFCYSDADFKVAKADAKHLLRHGADGLVFGFLHEDGTVDIDRTKTLVDIAEGKPTVFHRALDVTPDWKKALDSLIKLGITRVLTSGQQSNVFFALETIAQMIEFVDGAIEILPGAGITLENVKRVVEITGCNQVHLAKHCIKKDQSTANNQSIFFGGALYPPEDIYEVTDGAYVRSICDIIK